MTETRQEPVVIGSRFATLEETLSGSFLELTRVFDQLAVEYDLPDHDDVNRKRYPWSLPYLSSPALYAARMWEYPYAIKVAELEPSHRCVDVGCGMTPFTVFLSRETKCDVIGVDPDVYPMGPHYKGHGVSRQFLRQTGVRVIQASMQQLPLAEASVDRVFCLSVIEHLPSSIAEAGVREMARVLRDGGRAILTVDVNMLSEISKPLDLIWESGLLPVGRLDLRWPRERFGVFCDGRQPADVFGLVLEKDEYPVRTAYARESGLPELVGASTIPVLRHQNRTAIAETRTRSLPRRVVAAMIRTWRQVSRAGRKPP